MKKNKKGFTLIELLAVIVILAIIALIAVPLILNIIERARKGSFTRSSENVLKASNLYYTNSLLEVNQPEAISFTCDGEKCLSSKLDEKGNQINLNVDGSMGKGTVNIGTKGEVDFELSNGSYCALKTVDSKKITVNKGLCGEVTINTPSNLNISNITTNAGEIKVVGSVSNLDAELKGFQFSIDNGATWNPSEPSINKVYTFTGLELGKSYTVMMKVINLKDEEKIITKEITTNSIKNPTYKIEPDGWSREKVVTINYEEIDTNIYKNVYSIDNGNTFVEYIEPINVIENKNIIIDVQKKDDNKSILTTRPVINITKIDNEKPLDITLSSNSNSTYNQTLNVTITLQDGHSGLQTGSIKYGWSESNTVEPTSYTTVNTSATEGTNVTTITASSTDLTGSYYLWVVPINYKDNTENSNTTTVISTGTFNFDNEGPTLEIGEVTSTENTISIPITNNSDAYSNPVTTTCKAGLSTSDYNKKGTIENNTCTISGLDETKKYYYIVESKDNLNNEATSITGDITTKEQQPTYIATEIVKNNPVYYNPTVGSKCTARNYNTNLQNHIKAGNPTVTNLKSGCMKWYAYAQTSTTYTMILDHNTTATVQYNSANDNPTPKEVAQALSEDTENWKVEARLITEQEIRGITGNNGSKDFFFDGLNAEPKGSNPYSWLYDYIGGCEDRGCAVQDNNSYTLYGSTSTGSLYGYWTSSPVSYAPSEIWAVWYYGALTDITMNHTVVGIRPVITISK